MSIDILDMRRFSSNVQAIDIALPVLAIECEATPPLPNHLDAYEEAVLKLIALNLSTKGIARTLFATESLVEDVLSRLEIKEYAFHEIGKPWQLTDAGKNYLAGKTEDRVSDNSEYGFMFLNAIKKEILPYFHSGDLGQIRLYRGEELPFKLTLGGDETETFAPFKPKKTKLNKAFLAYMRNRNTAAQLGEGEIEREEAEAEVDMFADLDSFDEEEPEPSVQIIEKTNGNQDGLSKKMFIRALDRKPIKAYLRMRLIIDPSYPGGYRVESPFDLDGLDNNFFLRQLQWLEQANNTFIDDEKLPDFLNHEIRKLSPSYKVASKDFKVYVLEKMPLLKVYKSRFPNIYDDMERIYNLIQRQSSLIEKENIVNNLARSVVESLFNVYFKSMDPVKLNQIQRRAFDDISINRYDDYLERLCNNVGLDRSALSWVKYNTLKNIIGRLTSTYGNSIMEKFINMLVIEYHLGNRSIRRFLKQPDITRKYAEIDRLNQIRRKVSHDTNNRFTDEDYRYYMAHVFDLINQLIEALVEEH